MADRLSDLPDDLLHCILRLLPSKEAASTGVLSRRWGSVWWSSGAVNLAERFGYSDYINGSRRDAFLRAAHEALAAAGATDLRVTRLTLDVHGAFLVMCHEFLLHDDGEVDVLALVLSHPAARRGGGLRVAVSPDERACDDGWTDRGRWVPRAYFLRSASLPSETLRVLDIARCTNLVVPAAAAAEAAAFPRLETLQMRYCVVQFTHLQRLVNAAPGLATVHFESLFIDSHNTYNLYHDYESDEEERLAGVDTDDGGGYPSEPRLLLRFPAATALVLSSRHRDRRAEAALLHVQRLPRRFYVKSPAPDLSAVNLQFLEDFNVYPVEARAHFWWVIGSFTNARTLKLKVCALDDLVVAGKARRAALLRSFPSLERLSLETEQLPPIKKAAMAIANLLRCCPATVDLDLKLRIRRPTRPPASWSLHEKVYRDFSKSVALFRSRKSKPAAAAEVCSIDGDDDGEGIPSLSRRSFTCLQSSLRRVRLEFRMDSPNCFGVQLARFFAQNAMVLEEMRIDSGEKKLCEHMDLVERLFGEDDSLNISLKQKNSTDRSWVFSRTHPGTSGTSFPVLPLQIDKKSYDLDLA
uniref:F-box domain-containing protein n=1 Tax=Oryza brachyantha TaxID=4533 RepID=J3N2M2_ORYBR